MPGTTDLIWEDIEANLELMDGMLEDMPAEYRSDHFARNLFHRIYHAI